jgi:acrylyl-CoA reductase (NADPH)
MIAPFILRGVALLGINSVYVAKPIRIAAWERLARELDRKKLAAMTTMIGFEDIPKVAREIVDGKVRGRIVVRISG